MGGSGFFGFGGDGTGGTPVETEVSFVCGALSATWVPLIVTPDDEILSSLVPTLREISESFTVTSAPLVDTVRPSFFKLRVFWAVVSEISSNLIVADDVAP